MGERENKNSSSHNLLKHGLSNFDKLKGEQFKFLLIKFQINTVFGTPETVEERELKYI